jgi:hypothetical protein
MKKIITSIFALVATVGVNTALQAQTFSYTGSLQSITVPACADSVIITANGAGGGVGPYNLPGKGASIRGTFKVTPGEVLNMVVGQQGTGVPSGPYYCGSGGGGTYVWNTTNSSKPMVVAGGGGGNSYGSPVGGNGSADSIPTASTSCAAGGSNGNGGAGGTCSSPVEGGGGAGWYSNGDSGLGTGNGTRSGGGGLDPANGAAGGFAGNPGAAGGYGGGGGCTGNDGAGGGGGGYNGGGGGLCGGTGNWGAGGGGGSYNAGQNQFNFAGVDSGNGSVVLYFIYAGTYPVGPIAGKTSICKGSSLTFTCDSTGGGPFVWTAPAGATINSGQGTATVNVTFNGISGNIKVVEHSLCANDSDSVAITVNNPPTVLLTTDTAVCQGMVDSVSTTVTGAGGFTYAWNTGSTNKEVLVTTTGTYSVMVTDANGCSTDAFTNVTVYPIPTVTLSAFKDTACVNWTKDSLFVSPSGGIFSGAGVTNGNFNANTAGVGSHYVYYNYTDIHGCTKVDTITVIVNACLGVADIQGADAEVKIYPNPFSDMVHVDINANGSVKATMYNMLGESMGTWQLDKGQHTLDLSNIPAGVYTFQVKTQDGMITKKFVKVN